MMYNLWYKDMDNFYLLKTFSYFCIVKIPNQTMSIIHQLISKQLNISLKSVENTVKLLDEGATIPFISRYRKEATDALDEVQITDINALNDKFIELEKRKQTVLSSIEEQEKLTPELRSRIENCWDSIELEDIYLPYKPKRQTRAEMARKKGLEPLAQWLMLQQNGSAEAKAKQFITKEVANADAALKGACDIVAEWVNEDEKSRQMVRNIFAREAVITSKVIKGKEEEGEKFRFFGAVVALPVASDFGD